MPPSSSEQASAAPRAKRCKRLPAIDGRLRCPVGLAPSGLTGHNARSASRLRDAELVALRVGEHRPPEARDRMVL